MRISSPMVALVLACGPSVATQSGTDGETDSSGDTTGPPTPTPGPTTAPPPTSSDVTSSTATTETGTTGTTGGPASCEGGGCAVDVLVVVDNSGTMALEQQQIGRAMPQLEAAFRAAELDAQVMFTTTDLSNPLCSPFKPDGYEPASGAPIATACIDRIERFTGLGSSPDVVPEACTDTCPVAVAPEGDPFVAFSPEGDNVPDVPDADVNGDGTEDSPAAQAMACLAPMGIDGCGYESPLEAMLRALDASATWNQGDRPFLRDDAALAVVIVSDEADCSLQDPSIMGDETYQSIDPDTMNAAPSSAICWNAGVACDGPDAMGVYSNCRSTVGEGVFPVSRYAEFLLEDLRQDQGKEIVMLGLLGVPPVTAHAEDPPGTPTEGGALSLVYRNWQDGQFPAGDILPDEFAAGITAADKQFDFGIGPGCTGVDAGGSPTGQAVAPVRMRETCEALNLSGDLADQRCCLESICDASYDGAVGCLTGLITHVAAG